mmetsp:Transcript_27054/g.54060  ORF Transcript_27054/g.54060 Transcript_27054/m.54060 type:complete len:99 (-) Transcript_27054:310-606(-)
MRRNPALPSKRVRYAPSMYFSVWVKKNLSPSGGTGPAVMNCIMKGANPTERGAVGARSATGAEDSAEDGAEDRVIDGVVDGVADGVAEGVTEEGILFL